MRSAATPRETKPRAWFRLGASAILGASLLAPLPTAAQDDPAERSERPELRMFDDFARRMMQSLLQQITPDHEAWLDVLENVDRYEPPEVLPNGDLLIRRKPEERPKEPETAPEQDRETIDL